MQREKLNEGKTKVIWSIPGEDPPEDGPRVVEVESKDDITAGDGAKHDVLDDKAVNANETTCNVFELLKREGVPVAYVGRKSEKSFLAYEAEMIPLELVVRRIATGSYLKRNPEAEEGDIFEDLIFEFFFKDDDRHDPLVRFYRDEDVGRLYPADQPEGALSIGFESFDILKLYEDPWRAIGELEAVARLVFTLLEEAWAAQDIQLVDMKIECGWVYLDGEWTLVVADVIDNDSWRIWPQGEKRKQLDKQVYREVADSGDPKAAAKELGTIKQNYAEVADRTAQFA